MAWTEARIGYGRIGFLPIGGRFRAPSYHEDLAQGAFIIELRLPSGELVAIVERAIRPGYEELVDGIGQAWLSLKQDDANWAHIADGRIVVIRERSQRPKVFIIRENKEIRE
jgi:hypothetical protein